jgi:molybdopterin/thiamine biosynthesis adenylyltransferase
MTAGCGNRFAVNPPTDGWSLTLSPRLWADLAGHLMSDGDRHGAVILADAARGARGPRLLGRELILAEDDVDYLKGSGGYRWLSAEFVRDAAVRARDERLAYLAVHNHHGTTSVAFSRVDMVSHERGYPALRQITGQVVGALVLTSQAAAGDLWLPDGAREPLAEVVVLGHNLLRLAPRPAKSVAATEPRYQRQAVLFGEHGQHTLARLRVGVVGLGGIGSLVVELLSRLGVGELVLIDHDRVAETDLPRLVGAEPDDVGRRKTDVAARNATRANPAVTLIVLPDRVETQAARRAITSCDWIFLAADTSAARHCVNEVVHRYLIPATQAGVTVSTGRDAAIGQIHTTMRLLLPGQDSPRRSGQPDLAGLATDPPAEAQAASYGDGVVAPSVIAFNALAVAEAVTHFVRAVTGIPDQTGGRKCAAIRQAV